MFYFGIDEISSMTETDFDRAIDCHFKQVIIGWNEDFIFRFRLIFVEAI